MINCCGRCYFLGDHLHQINGIYPKRVATFSCPLFPNSVEKIRLQSGSTAGASTVPPLCHSKNTPNQVKSDANYCEIWQSKVVSQNLTSDSLYQKTSTSSKLSSTLENSSV